MFSGAAACIALFASGCSECRNDQDCASASNATDLLCVDGTCAAGTAEDVAAAACKRDADCEDGEVCFDDACVVVPTCQQLVGEFVARRESTAEVGTVTATTEGCEVRLVISLSVPGDNSSATEVPVAAERIAADGSWQGSTGFNGGSWNPALRVGVLQQVGGSVATGTVVFGTTDFACVEDADCAGQVIPTCRTACAGGDGCADDAPCTEDGFCVAATRGTCR